MAKLPDAASIFQKQMVFIRAMHDRTSRSAKERATKMISTYNQQARSKKLPLLPPLTDAILSDEAAKQIYITDVSNSGLSPEDKLIILQYIQNPQEAESIFVSAQAAANEARNNAMRGKEIAENAGVKHLEWTQENVDRWIRNPGQFLSEFV